VVFTINYLKHRKYFSGCSSLLADAGFAGLLFWMPTLLIGTPIIEFRTMLLLGMTLALPYLPLVRSANCKPQYFPRYAIA
jgi:hypothetical protein